MKIAPQYATALVLIAVAPWIIGSTADRHVDENSTTVSITGLGTAPQAARLLTMDAGVTSFATSAGRAWRDNADSLDDLRSELSRYGVRPEDIRTSSLDLSPTTKHEDGDDIKGFEVRHNLTITFRDINSAGQILDALVKAGANQIRGPRFSSDAGDQALTIARTAAIRDANTRAQFYARALGLRVKRVVTMRDGGGYASPQPVPLAYSAPTQISGGEDNVRVAVQGEYELVR